jgi:transcriptional regulator with XRE-family HTH domain
MNIQKAIDNNYTAKYRLDSQINRFIGRRVAEFRLQKGLSQSQLAQAIGKDSSTAISYFESGSRKVSIDDLIKIAKVLDKTLNDFLPQTAMDKGGVKEFAIKLRSNYKLDKETEKSILDFAELAKKKFGKNL